jgi:dTDP-4-dehydrorhamnose 3,5-epimerase
MKRLNIRSTLLSDLYVIKREQREDNRGFFSRMFCADELMALGWTHPVAQVNHSLTREQASVRGMHFQHSPHAENKLVCCLRGEVWDVAVDLRAGSPTFLKWHAERLSADNGCALLIPRGFAHGFQTLVPDCELIYMHDARYSPSKEDGINPLDSLLAIKWPLPLGVLSERDRTLQFLNKNFKGVYA